MSYSTPMTTNGRPLYPSAPIEPEQVDSACFHLKTGIDEMKKEGKVLAQRQQHFHKVIENCEHEVKELKEYAANSPQKKSSTDNKTTQAISKRELLKTVGLALVMFISGCVIMCKYQRYRRMHY